MLNQFQPPLKMSRALKLARRINLS